jgi:hypothetical protein
MSQADTYNPTREDYMVTKICNDCGQEKPLEDFTASNVVHRYGKSATHHAYCRMCNAARAREWRKNNTNYKGTGRIKSIPKEDRHLMSAIRMRLSQAKQRCKKYTKPEPVLSETFLYELFLKQERKCALTGATLVIERGHSLCLSLDQIDPKLGYVEGNVQWLAWCVNRAKGDLHLDDFIDLCEAVLVNRKVQRLSNGSNS